MSKPNLAKIEKMMEDGHSFSLTDKQYLKSTGCNIPKDNSYLLNKSAVSKRAAEHGYILKLVERTIIFEKI